MSESALIGVALCAGSQRSAGMCSSAEGTAARLGERWLLAGAVGVACE